MKEEDAGRVMTRVKLYILSIMTVDSRDLDRDRATGLGIAIGNILITTGVCGGDI